MFIKVSLVHSAQNLIELTLAVVVSVSKGRDCRAFVRSHENMFGFIRNPGDLFTRLGELEIL